MWRALLGYAIGIAVIVVLALPFGREIEYRYEVWRHADQIGEGSGRPTVGAQARLSDFERLRARCIQIYGFGSTECDRFLGAGE
ncbi:MAG TPA: hypothetical protein VFA12_01555 [Stellaceae bacterium]|nr:hypothetical protein [Stellaceae bacterium]